MQGITCKIRQVTLVEAETSNESKVSIQWNQQVQTNRTIHHDKLDIMICDTEKGKHMSIDVTLSGDRNVIKKEAKKIIKYKDLTTEIQQMWKVKTKITKIRRASRK